MASPTRTTKYHQLDEVDRRIVDFLRDDGRLAFREIARRLEVSESMVRKRVAKLLDAGWMRIQAISDPLQLGVPVVATTYAKVRPGVVERLTDRLAEDDAVRYIAVGIGSHNVVFESLHWSHQELHEFLQRWLGWEGISSSETIQVVKIKKSTWDWDIQPQVDAPAP